MPADYVDTRIRPSDLWDEGPRPKSTRWRVGDVLVLPDGDRVRRWVIRTLTGSGDVELEQTNAGAGVWWRTTLDRLPAKGKTR
ncbi:hypothetical protein [Microbacterium halophytorum]|uniref:hypothetical protein n=1 Tax=Microbacterium halophytorum TaxID=2067568 RepID=UPI001319E05C|nr:hypothetical protein [Microbacterium halophytorum]